MNVPGKEKEKHHGSTRVFYAKLQYRVDDVRPRARLLSGCELEVVIRIYPSACTNVHPGRSHPQVWIACGIGAIYESGEVTWREARPQRLGRGCSARGRRAETETLREPRSKAPRRSFSSALRGRGSSLTEPTRARRVVRMTDTQ